MRCPVHVPPRLATIIARRFIRTRDAEFILADLADDHAEACRARGRLAAGRRYWRLVLASIVAARRAAPVRWGRDHPARGLGNDARFAARVLRKNPGFTAVAVITLAVGIGANTSIFTVLDGVLLRPLPYSDADEIVNVWQIYREWQRSDIATFREMAERFPISWPVYVEWADRSRSLEVIAAYSDGADIVANDDGAEWIGTVEVTASLSRVLGVEPAVGRWFAADEDRGERVVVISDGFWRRRLAGDEAALGSTIRITGVPHTIVGVMPRGFYFPEREHELWIPVVEDRRNDRWTSQSLSAVARLRDGITIDVAQREMDAVADQIMADIPDALDAGVRLVGRVDEVAGATGPTLVLLMSSVGLVLAVAAANVAGLLLVRTSRRRHEFAVRVALGARRSRLFAQTLVEGGLLAGLGGGLGLLTVAWSIGALRALLPPETPRIEDVAVDWRMGAFTLAVSAIVALVFGIAAAAQAATRSPIAGLRGESSRLVGSRLGRSMLVVAQVAVSVVLLVGASLLGRSYLELQSVDRGFRSDGVVTASVTPPIPMWGDDAAMRQFLGSVLERLEAIPGVTRAAAVSTLPFSGGQSSTSFNLVEAPETEEETGWSLEQRVTPDYFEVMGIGVLRGRALDAGDTPEAAPAMVVNERLAATYFSDRDPVGESIWDDGTPYRIVGVVGDVKHKRLEEAIESKRYRVFEQDPGVSMTIVLGTDGDQMLTAAALRNALREVEQMATIRDVAALDQLVAAATALPRFRTLMLSALALIATLLAAIGVYGVIAFAVADRRREIGVRMTLGARGRDVRRQVVLSGLRLIVPGVALGLVVALAASRLVDAYLFAITPGDPTSFAGVALAVTLLSLLATWMPAWRASRVDPLVAVRSE